MPDEIDLTPKEDAALDAACDEVGREALAELGLSPAEIHELQAQRPSQKETRRKTPGKLRIVRPE
jgi:hypothetical protein